MEEGKIGTLLIKYLSRLGRNHLEVGTDMIFSRLNVRYIAVHDKYYPNNSQNCPPNFRICLNISLNIP